MEAKELNRVTLFERTMQKSHEWVNEIHEDIKWVSANETYSLLRGVLQSLRDQLSVHEAAQLSAQLPTLLRGAFYEDWVPKAYPPKGATKEEFLDSVKTKMGNMVTPNFDLESAALSALKVLVKHVSPGEINDVIGAQKPSLKTFIGRALPKEPL